MAASGRAGCALGFDELDSAKNWQLACQAVRQALRFNGYRCRIGLPDAQRTLFMTVTANQFGPALISADARAAHEVSELKESRNNL